MCSGCDILCEDLTNPPCSPECKPKCVCVKGYIRNVDSKCVLPRDCNYSKEGERPCISIFEKFSIAAHCQSTCEHPHGPSICTLDLVPGCVCIKPLLRGSTGKCTPVEECIQKLERG